MKPVNQKVVDGEVGDCFGACVASILELEDYPNMHTDSKSSWLDKWNAFLSERNLQFIEYKLGSFPEPVGYSILSVKSALFEGKRHAVVFYSVNDEGYVIHNPNPNDLRGTNIPISDWLSFKVFALVDPSKAVKR